MSGLKACPLCGGVAELVTLCDDDAWYCECEVCGCQQHAKYREHEAVIAWNTRTPDPAPLVEALEAVTDAIGDWARPTSANGMIAAGENHPLCVALKTGIAALDNYRRAG
jgi:hypothetical protein